MVVRLLLCLMLVIGVSPAFSQPSGTRAKASKPPAEAGAGTERPQSLDSATAVQRANAFFNGSTTMISNFVQIGGDGRRSEGTLYVQRPGRMRFEYAKPATLEIVSDGTSVAIRDRKLAT